MQSTKIQNAELACKMYHSRKIKCINYIMYYKYKVSHENTELIQNIVATKLNCTISVGHIITEKTERQIVEI